MKLRIVIKGPKVHDVGYRYFLMTKARSARIRRFDAENLDGAVEILVEGDESKVAAFKKLVETSHPERAEISDISSEDYDGEVMPISEYSHFCTNIQLNKAIPVLLNIVERIDKMSDNLGGKMDQMLDKQDQALGKMDQMLDKQDQALGKMDQMLDKQDQALGKMDQMLGKQGETIEILSDMDEKMGSSLFSMGKRPHHRGTETQRKI